MQADAAMVERPRLTLENLAQIDRRARRPGYDPRRCRIGIVHLGVGHFHRAHQAVYTDDALAAGETDWAIAGANLRRTAMPQALAPQDGLYTLIEREHDQVSARVIGALREWPHTHPPDVLLAALAAPATRIVSMTVSEKGYTMAATGGLDFDHPEIVADLTAMRRRDGRGSRPAPQSALGWLIAGLDRRARQSPRAALTLLSCDNLPANGRTLERLLRDFAQAAGREDLADWMHAYTCCPDSMVDRIVPASRQADRDEALLLTGLRDEAPVACERFSQWVIRDDFVAGRPGWERSGVQFVDDVAAWEDMKLRLLNAAHSALAYLGHTAGLLTVDRAMAEPALRRFIERLWHEEVIPTLEPTVQSQAPAYCARLVERFGNRAIGHSTLQIAMDGSKKIPLRWLPTLERRRRAREPSPALALALAAWVRHLDGNNDEGRVHIIDDPKAAHLCAKAPIESTPTAIAALFASVPGFEALAADIATCAEVARALVALRRDGALATLARWPSR